MLTAYKETNLTVLTILKCFLFVRYHSKRLILPKVTHLQVKMAERRTCLSVLLFLLHLLVIKAKFCANKIQTQLAESQDIRLMFCVVLHAMMLQTGMDFVGVMHKTRVGDAILDLEQEGYFVSDMKSKYPYLLHLLCCYCGVIFVQILDLATSDTLAEYVRKQSKVTNKESVVTFVKYGFLQEAHV